MKFNDDARIRFKKELQQFALAQEKKYGVKISFLTRENEPNYFGIKVKEIVEQAPQRPARPEVRKPMAPKKPNLDDLDNLDVDSLDFSDLEEDEAKPNIKPRKPEIRKPMAPKKPNLDDLDNLDVDSLDFSDLAEDEVKPNIKPRKPEVKKSMPKEDDLDDLDIDSLDFSDLDEEFEDKGNKKGHLDDIEDIDIDSLDFSDLEEEEEKPLPKPKKKHVDDEDRYSQELEKYLGGSYGAKKAYDDEPDNIFDEKSGSYDDDISDEEIDAYLASSGKYSYSFQAKLIQSEVEIQDYYTDVKNLLLSYDGVKSKVGWDYDAFVYKGRDIARIDIEDGMLCLYLKLEAGDYLGSYENAVDHKNPKFRDTKLLYIISSISDVDGAYELIEDLATDNHIYPGEDRYDDYHFEYETNDELIARGLIKKN